MKIRYFTYRKEGHIIQIGNHPGYVQKQQGKKRWQMESI